ncbi:hypothetical protein APHAL10511_003311 [Amanita phalloides]|nr:hypothetical protein APHAL10511_003311 [Amanita phalloides]
MSSIAFSFHPSHNSSSLTVDSSSQVRVADSHGGDGAHLFRFFLITFDPTRDRFFTPLGKGRHDRTDEQGTASSGRGSVRVHFVKINEAGSRRGYRRYTRRGQQMVGGEEEAWGTRRILNKCTTVSRPPRLVSIIVADGSLQYVQAPRRRTIGSHESEINYTGRWR